MTEAYRQSALLLHGLGNADRQWILGQLTEVQRQGLAAQLAELEALGMPADRTLAEEALAWAAAEAGAGNLRLAPAQAVLALLEAQPAWLIATVLAIEAWPWREAIYAGLDASKRERVKQAMGERPPRKLAQALVARLEARLAAGLATPQSRSTIVKASKPAGLKQWFRP